LSNHIELAGIFYLISEAEFFQPTSLDSLFSLDGVTKVIAPESPLKLRKAQAMRL
jgi:hypothetical protein